MRQGKIHALADFDAQGLNELWMWFQARDKKRNFMVTKTADGGGGGGGGGTTLRKLLLSWGGLVPSVLGNSTVWRVPYDTTGSSFTFTLTRAYIRVELPSVNPTSVRLEKSAGGDVLFSPTTITSLSVSGAGDYEQEVTSFSTSVSSGDLVRLVFTAVGAEAAVYEVELIGSQ